MKTRIFLSGLIFLSYLTGSAQEKTVVNQSLIWYGATVQKQFNNGYDLSLKVEKRDFISPQRNQQLVLPDIKVGKKLSHGFKLDAGLWVFTIYQPVFQDLAVNEKQYELRPYFTVNYKHPLSTGSFDFAIKSEFRGFNAPGAEHHFDQSFNTYVIRERFLVRYNLPLTAQLMARFAEELHLNIAGDHGQGTFDQNRLTGQLVYTIGFKESDDKLKLQAGYLHWYQPTGVDNVFLSHHIITSGVSFEF